MDRGLFACKDSGFSLPVLNREQGNMVCRDFVGIIYPYSLPRTSKFRVCNRNYARGGTTSTAVACFCLMAKIPDEHAFPKTQRTANPKSVNPKA